MRGYCLKTPFGNFLSKTMEHFEKQNVSNAFHPFTICIGRDPRQTLETLQYRPDKFLLTVKKNIT